MHFKNITFALLIMTSFLFSQEIKEDKFDLMKKIEEKALIDSKNIDLTNLKQNVEVQNKLLQSDEFENKYEQVKKNMDIEIRRMSGEDVALEDMRMSVKKNMDIQKILARNKIYIFISESIPLSNLHAYAKVISDKNLTNTLMVLRGCVGGNCREMKKTIDFANKISEYDKNKKVIPNLIIDPMLFRKYDLKEVPCVIYAENVQIKDISISEGNDENFNASNTHKSCGAWDLLWHLKSIQKGINSKDLEQIINYIEPKGGV